MLVGDSAVDATETRLTFNDAQVHTAAALFDRLFPADDGGPSVAEIGVLAYLDRALAGPYADRVDAYRLGLAALDRAALALHGATFPNCAASEQDVLIRALEAGTLPNFHTPPQREFLAMLMEHLQEGLFADPAYGGNRGKLGWQLLGHPGVWLENSAAENLSPEPVTKGGRIQSLADLGFTLGGEAGAAEIPGYDPQRGVRPPDSPADVILVGFGGMGAFVAPTLCEAGLRVVALEAGPYRTAADFLPDELGAAYYCRAGMGAKFNAETPRWRRHDDEGTREATFSLGRMMNSVGGSIIHYGAWLRRYHPHHFRPLSHARERWGEGALPEGSALADWPVCYHDLEPYYARVERVVGVTGDPQNPFVPRSGPYPMPALRPFRLGELFRGATEAMGLHPHMVPVGMNSVPYEGRPATTYTAWSNGFGSRTGDKWHPALSTVPQALATGNLDLRTHCRVLKLLTDAAGRASGVEYVDANGVSHVQRARTVILAGYTFENVRLMLLSGDARHPDGLGNGHGQLGRYYMTKMFAHVDGHFPDVVFNRHTGPAAQGMVLDDFLSADFDGPSHGFLGGGTLGTENQFLPLQISRESLPPGVQAWGRPYREHLKGWQHLGVVRVQPDAVPYHSSRLDLDPRHRDRSGLGLPVVRITYDLQPDEHRRAAWLEGKAAEILRSMGARQTWCGPRFTGVGSSHDMGGCRMGESPTDSVVDPELRVHDTPGLYVLGGAVCPTCPGINPTLTLWALALRATERLVARLRSGEER